MRCCVSCARRRGSKVWQICSSGGGRNANRMAQCTAHRVFGVLRRLVWVQIAFGQAKQGPQARSQSQNTLRKVSAAGAPSTPINHTQQNAHATRNPWAHQRGRETAAETMHHQLAARPLAFAADARELVQC